jgi:hypothetical protein
MELEIFAPILKNVRGVEKSFGEYLFNTYVLPKINLDGFCKEERDKKLKEERDNFNKEFFRNRPQTISQREQILQDVEDLEEADSVYERYPKYADKVTKTVYGYPDRYRCDYIILSKHKYHRCKAKVAVDEDEKERVDKRTLAPAEYNDMIYSDYCCHHIHCENEHLDAYIELIQKYTSEEEEEDNL